jgi:hypothetical protein
MSKFFQDNYKNSQMLKNAKKAKLPGSRKKKKKKNKASSSHLPSFPHQTSSGSINRQQQSFSPSPQSSSMGNNLLGMSSLADAEARCPKYTDSICLSADDYPR